MSRYILRKTRLDDWEALASLHTVHTGSNRTKEQFEHLWFACPAGPALSWVIEDAKTDKVAAHHGFIPVPFSINGQSRRFGRTENSMIDPDYKGKLPYVAYEAKVLPEARQTYDGLYTSAALGAHGKVREYLGYKTVGPWSHFVLYANAAWFEKRATGRTTATKVITRLGVRLPDVKGDWTLGQADAQNMETYWHAWQESDCGSIERTADYLTWRIFASPHKKYQVNAVFRNGTPKAFVTWSIEPDGESVRIEDLFIENADPSIIRNTARLLGYQQFGAPARVYIRCWPSSTPFHRALTKAVAFPWRGPQSDSLIRFLGSGKCANPDFGRMDLTLLSSMGL